MRPTPVTAMSNNRFAIGGLSSGARLEYHAEATMLFPYEMPGGTELSSLSRSGRPLSIENLQRCPGPTHIASTRSMQTLLPASIRMLTTSGKSRCEVSGPFRKLGDRGHICPYSPHSPWKSSCRTLTARVRIHGYPPKSMARRPQHSLPDQRRFQILPSLSFFALTARFQARSII